jgi:hypothetical protein
MRVAELMNILHDYPQEWQVELALVAPVEVADEEITVDRYTIEGVLPWEEDKDETVLWLVGGEDDNVDAFLDAIDT